MRLLSYLTWKGQRGITSAGAAMESSCATRFPVATCFLVITFCCYVTCDDLTKKQVLAPRQLLPYQAYKDVQLFHYAVPEQVVVGEWQFRTNLTITCGEPIEVTVTLQHGSYPVVSSDAEGSVDSPIVATPRQPVRVLQLDPDEKRPATINVTSPMPGDWFAAAFYSSANPNRKRWRLRCEVWLSSTATFHIDSSVVLLITEYPMNQKITRVQRYRFFASESMWFARITLTECDPCPVVLSFQPRVFPIDEKALARVDCTITECALEVAVAEDDWNYIVVEPLEPGIISYRIEVQSAICPMEGIGDQYNDFTIQPVPKPFIKTKNGSECPSSLSETFGTLNARHCYSRLELIRQKLPGNFAFRYSRLTGYSFVSPVVNVSTLHPSLAMFRVMPIVDIGGTFTVEADVPPPSVSGNTKLSLEACLQYNERPHITEEGVCSAGFGMYLNTSTANSSNGKLMVPFPEAGLWYLLLKPRCYVEKEGKYTTQVIYVPCPMNTTPVVLRLESGPCSLGQCGEYGRCYQYLSGGLVFSSCLCTAGRKGWDCGDDSEAHTYAQLMVTVLLLTVSNILYLPVTVLAIYRRYFTEALVYLTAMVFSALFHACDFEVSPFCVIRLSVLQYCDVYASVLAVWLTMVALADLPTSGRSLSNMIGALGLAVGVEYDRTGFWVFLVPIGAGLFLASVSWGCHCYYQRRCFIRKLSWFRLMIGFGLMASGLVLFAMFEGHPNYAYVHSGRHACFALALLFLLPGRKSTKGMQDGINTCSYIRVEELSDISHPLECGVYQHLLTPTP